MRRLNLQRVVFEDNRATNSIGAALQNGLAVSLTQTGNLVNDKTLHIEDCSFRSHTLAAGESVFYSNAAVNWTCPLGKWMQQDGGIYSDFEGAPMTASPVPTAARPS